MLAQFTLIYGGFRTGDSTFKKTTKKEDCLSDIRKALREAEEVYFRVGDDG